MKLSVVIVNYNVRYFLSTCLQSVFKSCEGLDVEVFVVDNNSSDDSVKMVRDEFPEVNLIANKDNRGFSKANNQAIERASGDYILLLNPDTIVDEDCFKKCVEYLDEHNDCGGLGVKMIDGSGKFLPESKRGLPTPSVAFYKIFGLSRIFPKSKKFGKYHLGYLDKNETHEVDVLSGAFMMLRKGTIDKIGGLDEDFFMYGEDIDLSYRISKAGYKNIYFSQTSIIHFKGESTKKSSVNYVLVFYRAMIIFARKHFSQKNASLFSFLINLAVYFRAGLAIVRRFFERIYVVLLDSLLLIVYLNLIKGWYEIGVLKKAEYFEPEVSQIAFPIMTLIWIGCQAVFGGYRQPVGMKTVFKGLFLGGILIVTFYGMLNEEYRFSRAIIAVAISGSFFLLPSFRLILSKLNSFKLNRFSEMKTGVIGSIDEIEVVSNILNQSAERKKRVVQINHKKKSETEFDSDLYMGSLYQLKDLKRIYSLNEVIYCLKNVSAKNLISSLEALVDSQTNIYLKPASGNFLLRSSSMDGSADYIIPVTNPKMDVRSRRKKRFSDIVLSSVLLIASPFLLFLYNSPTQFIKNMFNVLFNKSWLVGVPTPELSRKPMIIYADYESLTETERKKKEIDYLVKYSFERDLEIVFSKINQLDQVLKL